VKYILFVDFFWVWGIGAMFAVAASRQLKNVKEEDIWTNKWFVILILFMAIDFGASGMILLWTNWSWETMQVYWLITQIPLWLVLLWSVCNVVLPIIAYWWSFKLIKKGKEYEAMLLSLAGYVLFFFILFYGWDGTGYQRFFYDATGTVLKPTWDARVMWTLGQTVMTPWDWFGSNIAVTLYILGFIFLGPHFYICVKWAVKGMRDDPALKGKVPEKGMKPHFMIVLGALLIVGAGCIMALIAGGFGWICIAIGGDPLWGFVGIPVVGIVSYPFLFKRGKLFHKMFDKFFNLA
jgi:hypothetical protein